MSGALDGYKIVDITQVISGPLATRILADQGADVIKVEPPVGDIIRHMGGQSGFSPPYLTINRSKRSIVLDLKQESAKDVLKRMVATADVFIQNNRPGAVERMGLDYETLRKVNPKLVYVSISGFGETGPYSHKRVYDPIIQGMSGLCDIQGGVQGPPRLMRVIIPDKVTAMTAAQSITAALLSRERTGVGQHVQIAMLDAVIAFAWPEGMAYNTLIDERFAGMKPVDRRDLVFETKNGFMIASTVAHREFQGFCRAANKPEWLADERFQNTAGLVKHARERLDMMAEVLLTRTTEDWLSALDAEDVPCGPVLKRENMHQNAQIQANQILVEGDHPVMGRIRQPRPAERMGATPSEIRRPAPGLGEHTQEVLESLGLSAEEIASLREEGVLGAA